MRKVFRFVFVFTVIASLCFAVQAQTPDPLAELESWNKIKECSVAADYHAFLKEFPNGSLAARAREKMNTLGDPVWNELKESNDPFKYRDYIKANPNSPFLDQAKARLEVLTVAMIEWEKVKAVGDMQSIMRLISTDPSGPFAPDAKAMIEQRLWDEIALTGTEDHLKFYAEHYAGTDRGKQASTRYLALLDQKKEREFAELKARFVGYGGKWLDSGTGNGNSAFNYIVTGPCSLLAVWSFDPTDNSLPEKTEFPIDISRAGTIWVYSSFLNQTAASVRTDAGYQLTSKRTYYSRNPRWGTFVPKASWESSLTEPYYEQKSAVWIGSFTDKATAERFKADYLKLVNYCSASRSGR